MHAHCLGWLINNLTAGAKVLDVGSGSGWLSAAFYELVKDFANLSRTAVVGIEHIEPIYELSLQNLKKSYSS